MQKRLRTLLAVGPLAVLGVVAWEGLRPREPVYQGKALSQWMECFSANGGNLWADNQRLPRAALAQAGTNAIPVLLKMLQAEESPGSRIMSLLSRQRVLKIRYFQPRDRNWSALIGFLYYRESASNAVPEPIKITVSCRPLPARNRPRIRTQSRGGPKCVGIATVATLNELLVRLTEVFRQAAHSRIITDCWAKASFAAGDGFGAGATGSHMLNQ